MEKRKKGIDTLWTKCYENS